MTFNANSTEIEKMDTDLRDLELTLSEDEKERLLLVSSGEEDSPARAVSSVTALSEADLLKIASLRSQKNKRNHERARLRKLLNPTPLAGTSRAVTVGSGQNSTFPKGSEKVLERDNSDGVVKPRAETLVSDTIPTSSKGDMKVVESHKSVGILFKTSEALTAASNSRSGDERLNSQVRKRTRLAVNPSTLSTGLSREIAATSVVNEPLAGTSANSKRNRSENSQVGVPPKKPRMMISFSDAVKESLVMLVRRGEGSITVDQFDVIRRHLYRSLDATPYGNSRPVFVSSRLIDGVIVIECANAMSFDWLSECFSTPDILEGVPLKFNSKAQEVPKRKIVVYLPDKDQVDTQLLFIRLKSTNMDLNTDSWSLLRDLGASSRGRTLVFAVDLASVQYILAKNSKLYYMLQMIYVEVRARYEPRFFSRPTLV